MAGREVDTDGSVIPESDTPVTGMHSDSSVTFSRGVGRARSGQIPWPLGDGLDSHHRESPPVARHRELGRLPRSGPAGRPRSASGRFL